MKYYIFTGDTVRDRMIASLASRIPLAEVTCALPDNSTFSETCTVTSLSVIESNKRISRSEYAVVLYGDEAYLSSGTHSDFTVEYGEKYRAVGLPLSVERLNLVFEEIHRGQSSHSTEKPCLLYDRGAGSLSYMGRTEYLTKLEAKLYELFRRNGNIPLSKEEIKEELWGDSCRSNAPDVYVSYLRRKLDRLTGDGSITNIRGVGYKLNI